MSKPELFARLNELTREIDLAEAAMDFTKSAALYDERHRVAVQIAGDDPLPTVSNRAGRTHNDAEGGHR
jgi:hypothetical protein